MTTSKAEQLKNQIAQTATQTPAQQKPLTPSQQVGAYLEKMMPAIQAVLPKHVTADRMSRIALNVIRTNPKLLECDINSLMGSVMESAKLGLEPGLMGQAYLIPFKNNKTNTTECQFLIGYKGLIDLVRRSGQVSTIEARVVYENDVFEFEYGLDDKLIHKPTLTDKGAPIAYYAVCKLKDGGSSFIVMSHQEMLQYRDKYAKSKNFGPWVSEFEAMAKKTTLRQLIKYLPISVEFLGVNDEASGIEVHRELENSQMVDGGFIPTIDGETGELVK
ncbi:recombination protein RecT [Solibacillus sp. FSL W8-0474]|uniref:recombination protein RecT n=1 Tax=Solibacillus sp. FSL W8-0474 TaxID=2975336 RepID=UPI0030F4D35C